MVITITGKKPTKQAIKESKQLARCIKKHGDKCSKNRYLVFEGDILRAGQETKSGAMKFFKKGLTLVRIK